MPPPEPAVADLSPEPVPDEAATALRCAAHPGRPAADQCPVCGRPRCAVDALPPQGDGCTLCGGRPTGPRGRPPVDVRALAGAATLCHLVAVASAYVGQQYVDVDYFEWLVPVGVGIVCAIAAERGAGRARGLPVRIVAAVYAVLSTALSFRLEASLGVFEPLATVLPPYLCAAAGAWFWTQPPSQRAARKRAERSADS